MKRLGEGMWVKRFRSLARARALLCLPPSSMAASIARVRIADAGVLAWGSSCLEGVFYDTKGRYGVREHSGHYFFWPRE